MKLHAYFDLTSLEVPDVALHLCDVSLYPTQDFKDQVFGVRSTIADPNTQFVESELQGKGGLGLAPSVESR